MRVMANGVVFSLLKVELSLCGRLIASAFFELLLTQILSDLARSDSDVTLLYGSGLTLPEPDSNVLIPEAL